MKKIFIKTISIFIVIMLIFSSITVYAHNNSTIPGDEMVYYVQKWLNQTYGNDSRFNLVNENGKTGWNTINGLIRAMQIELGIQNTADNFGPSSQKLYGQNPLKRQDGVSDNKYAILQCALWCKGYSPGYNMKLVNNEIQFKAVFDEKVENAVISLKKDMGFLNPDGIVTVNVMKSLLSMDSFKLLPSSYGSNPQIREMQQSLNRKYESYIGIMPCDGVYGANTNKALIKALQIEEGIPKESLSSNFGNATKGCCPNIPYEYSNSSAKKYKRNTNYTQDEIKSITELLQYSLLVNGYYNGVMDGTYNNETENAVRQFQNHYMLDATGKCNIDVWMALLTSKGNPDRPAIACDCATILTEPTAKTLKDNGYKYVGRYLTGTYNGGISKAITRQEASIIFKNGLSFFPIYQTSARNREYFTVEQGTLDANLAFKAADDLGIPKQSIIYFAVDYDCTDYDTKNFIIPYFKSIYETLSPLDYKIGIYGTRNTCVKVSNAGYSVSSFISDMSTGFSGNLGFKIPDNWAFDQFATVSIGSGAGKIEIDKDAYSGRDNGVNRLEPIKDINKVTKGDLSLDGVLDSMDFSIYCKIICGEIYLTDDLKKISDLNNDGAVDGFDAIEFAVKYLNYK